MQGLSRTEFDLAEYAPIISEVIESGGEFRLFPRGTSMLPLIRQGVDSVILIKPAEKLKKREIIFYRRDNGQFVLHRILKVSKDGTYILCGDNQTALEKQVRRDSVIASVSAVYRSEKRVDVTAFSFRLYQFFWCVMPIRKIIFFARRVLSKIKRIIKGQA